MVTTSELEAGAGVAGGVGRLAVRVWAPAAATHHDQLGLERPAPTPSQPRRTDAAGNTGAASSSLVSHHRHLGAQRAERPRPDSSIGLRLIEQRQPTNVAAATYTGTAEGGQHRHPVRRASSVGQAVATGGSYTITRLRRWPMADHTLTATATDPAGNTAAPRASLVRLHRHWGARRAERPRPDRSIDSGSSSTDNLTKRGSRHLYRHGGGRQAPSPCSTGAVSVGQAVATGGSYTITQLCPGRWRPHADGDGDRQRRQHRHGSGSLVVSIDTSAPAAPSASGSHGGN